MTVIDFIRKHGGEYGKISVYDADTMQAIPGERLLYYEVLDMDEIEENVLSISATRIE